MRHDGTGTAGSSAETPEFRAIIRHAGFLRRHEMLPWLSRSKALRPAGPHRSSDRRARPPLRTKRHDPFVCILESGCTPLNCIHCRGEAAGAFPAPIFYGSRAAVDNCCLASRPVFRKPRQGREELARFSGNPSPERPFRFRPNSVIRREIGMPEADRLNERSAGCWQRRRCQKGRLSCRGELQLAGRGLARLCVEPRRQGRSSFKHLRGA